MGKKVVVFSIDFDGCYAHVLHKRSKLYDMLRKQNITTKNAVIEKHAVESNALLLEHIVSLIGDMDQVIIAIGTARQDMAMDTMCSFRNGTPLAMPLYNGLKDVVARESRKPVELDKMLLADIFGYEQAIGSSFQEIVELNKKIDYPIRFSSFGMITAALGSGVSQAIEERGGAKNMLLYAQMHRIAAQHPGEDIIFNFVDDREDILDTAAKFYSKHFDLIPQGMELQLYRYKGDASPVWTQSILGVGMIDVNYPWSLRYVAATSYCFSGPENAPPKTISLSDLKKYHASSQYFKAQNKRSIVGFDDNSVQMGAFKVFRKSLVTSKFSFRSLLLISGLSLSALLLLFVRNNFSFEAAANDVGANISSPYSLFSALFANDGGSVLTVDGLSPEL